MVKHAEPSLIKRATSKIAKFFSFFGELISHAVKLVVGLFKKDKTIVVEKSGAEKPSQSTQVFDSVSTSKSKKKKDALLHKMRILPHISKEHLSGEGQTHINMFRPQNRNASFLIGTALTSFKLLIVVIMMIGSAGIGTLVGVAKAYMETTPTLDTGKIENQSETSYIFDANDDLITAYTGVENRDWASITEIPEFLQDAVIAIEDVRFEYHTGVDVKRLLGAFLSNLMNDDVQGGSTLTQQLIKNRLLTFDRTYERKIQEAYLAFQLEDAYTKEDILEAYMNTIHLGASNYGVKAAAMDYFGKSLDELSLRECAMIAGIIRYPYYYNPRRVYYNAEKPEIVNDRTDIVLYQMYISEFITELEYQDALVDTVRIVEESVVLEMYDMPYFVEYAVYDVITHFLKQRNMQDTSENRASIENEIRTNGYRIYTTVDPRIQNIVQDSLHEWENYPALEDESSSLIRDESSSVITEIIQPQAAVVVMDHKTGDLLAVVGGRETPTAKKTLNRVYQTTMPVGSSIKPIAVYAPAIDKGYSDGSVVPNLPLPINGWDTPSGYPLGGRSKYGPVTLRTALVSSLNSATAYTLLEYVGLADSKNYLINLGVNPAHISETGAGLALGTSGITPIEMAGAYATIANGGVYLEPLSFRYVTDKEGNVILSADTIREKRQVFKPSTAWLVTDMLIDAVEYGTGTRAQVEGMTIGGKTGTNQNATGVFFAGISPYYTTTLWIGHDMYDPLADDVYASNSAAPLWQNIMTQLLEGLPNKGIIETSPQALGLVRERICTVSGSLATDACEDDPGDRTPKNYWYLDGTQPTKECDIHEIYTVCTVSGKIASSYCPTDIGILEDRSLLFLEQSSIYWDLTQEKRDIYLPGALKALIGLTVVDLTPSMDNYYDYICDVHTELWYNNQQALQATITAANAQIAVSYTVLADESLGMSEPHKQELQAKITTLELLIAGSDAALSEIEQATLELQILTDTLVTFYDPPPPPEETPPEG